MVDSPKGLRPRLAPSTRLVVVVGAALLPPAVGELVFDHAAQQVLVLVGIVLVIAALVDATLGVGLAGGISASMRSVTRLVLGRTASVEVDLESDSKLTRGFSARVAVSPPRSLRVEESEVAVTFAAAARPVRVVWRVRPASRGHFPIGDVHLERDSPLGLWRVRWSIPLAGEVRVYPNLLGEDRRLAALFFRRPFVGWRTQRQVGRGRDFEKLREYLPGDGFDEIHWKATAKRGHPVTKIFQVERTQEVYAIVDASRLSGRPARDDGTGEFEDTLLERQINAALALAVAAERQGDLFGLVTYTDRPRGFVRAKRGPAHFQACRETLATLRAEPVSPDLREVCAFLRTRLTKRALLVFLTSLDDPALAESFVEAARMIARRHLVLVASALPRDAAPLFTGEAPDSLDATYARLGGHIRWQGLQDLGAALHRNGVQLALLGRDELAAGAVSQYMSLKQRQLI